MYYKLQPPQKFHRRYLHSALRYLDEAPRNFLKKNFFTQQPYPLPWQNTKVTYVLLTLGRPPIVLVLCIPRLMHVLYIQHNIL
jgi:exonuclease I